MWKALGTLGAVTLLAGGASHGQGVAELRGQVAQPVGDSVLVSWRAQPLSTHEQTVRVSLNSRGEFRLAVPVRGPVLAELRHGDAEAPVYLEPGDALNVRFDGARLATTLKFESVDGSAHRPAANANNYLDEYESAFTNNEGYQLLPENVRLAESAFLSFLDYRRNKQRKLLKGASGRAAFTAAFAAHAQAEIEFLYANDRLTFADLRRQVMGAEARLQLTPGYYDYLREPGVLPGAESSLSSPQCQEFALNYVHYQVRADGLAPDAPGFYPACYRLAARAFQGPLRALTMGRVLLEMFRLGHLGHSQALLVDYAATAQAPPAWLELLRQELADHRVLAIGSAPPALPLRTAGGDSVQLAAHKGKLVYVLFWDQRLPQCQRELPHLVEVVRAFTSQPIVFLSAALTENQASQLPDYANLDDVVRAQVPAAAVAAVRTAYGIDALPRVLLLAEDGTVLDPRPKRPSIHALLSDLRQAFGRAAAYQAVPLPPK